MATITGPTPLNWTRDAYERAVELGAFGDLRVELIEGQVLQMSPMGARHITACGLVTDALLAAFGKRHFIRVQASFSTGKRSQPEPDIAVVRGARRDYKDRHPEDAELVVEVSESSLAFDRTTKLRLYAASEVPEYWIVNLIEEQIEVHRKPHAKKGQYTEQMIARRGEILSPLAAPRAKILIDDLLP